MGDEWVMAKAWLRVRNAWREGTAGTLFCVESSKSQPRGLVVGLVVRIIVIRSMQNEKWRPAFLLTL